MSAKVALRVAAIAGEAALLTSTAAIGITLVGPSSPVLVWAVVGGIMSVEITRLPLVMRAGQLGWAARIGALALATGISVLTMETQLLGVESVLTARAENAAVAATRLAEAQATLAAAKSKAGQQETERQHLVEAVTAAQHHVEEVARAPVTVQNNPNVSALRTRKGSWIAPGTAAANVAASANAKAQSDHARAEVIAEADLNAARSTLAGLKPIDIQVEEKVVAELEQGLIREQAASPMHRVAAMLFGVQVATPEEYEKLRRIVAVSVASLVSLATLAAGFVSTFPDRANKPRNKLLRTLRGIILARRRRHPVIVHRDVPGPVRTEYRDRIVHIPVDRTTGLVVDPDKEHL